MLTETVANTVNNKAWFCLDRSTEKWSTATVKYHSGETQSRILEIYSDSIQKADRRPTLMLPPTSVFFLKPSSTRWYLRMEMRWTTTEQSYAKKKNSNVNAFYMLAWLNMRPLGCKWTQASCLLTWVEPVRACVVPSGQIAKPEG